VKHVKMSPLMTAKELREYTLSNPDKIEAQGYLDDMKNWFFDQVWSLTNAEEYAFKNEINRLYRYISGSEE